MNVMGIFRIFVGAQGTKHFFLHHLAETDNGIERCPEFMAHIGKEFRLRPVCRFSAGFFTGIFVGQISEALGLLVSQQALFLQIANRHHQGALREQQTFFLFLQRRNIGSHRNKAAIPRAALVDLQPAAVTELNFERFPIRMIAANRWHILAHDGLFRRLGDRGIRRARNAGCGGQGVKLLVF